MTWLLISPLLCFRNCFILGCPAPSILPIIVCPPSIALPNLHSAFHCAEPALGTAGGCGRPGRALQLQQERRPGVGSSLQSTQASFRLDHSIIMRLVSCVFALDFFLNTNTQLNSRSSVLVDLPKDLFVRAPVRISYSRYAMHSVLDDFCLYPRKTGALGCSSVWLSLCGQFFWLDLLLPAVVWFAPLS